MELNDKITAIITGGASGLGEATARNLAAYNVKVGLFDLDETRGKSLATELGGIFAKVDVSDSNSVAAGFETCRSENGQERILVNCAGVASSARTVSKGKSLDASEFERVIRINLLGTFLCASTAAAGMSALKPLGPDNERGVIVNTASIAAYEGQIGQVAYAASKAGVIGMTLPMARDLSRDGVRVITIAPGIFETPMLRGLSKEVQESLARQVPFPPRLGDPSEYAALVAHIARNRLLNGETIRLDGAARLAIR